ncbi:MAG TPA: cytochrome-c peroxidase, partial [Bacteroidia bacterium]|nr:cytochrome-c peroxidase [Bacteroidia bacterium]
EASLTSQEADGLATFRTKCAGCHPEPLFTDEGFHNIGLPVDNTLNDEGRMHITLDPADSLKFRTPTLRNVALSGPYMHDGRFTTLQQCMDFFTDGVQAGPTLDTLMTPDTGIPLTPQEKSDLIAFMGTLTDMSFIQDPKFKEQH